MSVSLSFFGAAGTVTGSRYLLESSGKRMLVDCGLFQGLKDLRQRNWATFPVPPSTIDTVVLTHAHLDHTGYLPALVRDGYKGKIFATPATIALARILLPDSGFLQEQDAAFANRKGFSRHKPALPLYTLADAERSLGALSPVPFGQDTTLPSGASVHMRHAGHILGAATVQCDWGGKRVVFSGDIGRYNDPILPDPEPVESADYLLVESTYGDRKHAAIDPADALLDIILNTVRNHGTIVIPAFAVGRAQSILYQLFILKNAGRLPDVPIYIDSPMATDVTDILCNYPGDLRLTQDACQLFCKLAHYVRSVDESKALDMDNKPKIIISASGMATGGRVLHHLKRFGPDPHNTILFAGYQAAGTRGEAMVHGAQTINIHGETIPIRAEVKNLSMLSAHGDADEILKWLSGFKRPPKKTFIIHGESESANALKGRIEKDLHWDCHVPDQGEKVALD